jgi:hypothetical protein
LRSTPVENVRQITPFYAKQTQYYAFFARKRRFYEKTKPIQTQLKPIQSQFNPKQTQFKPNFERITYSLTGKSELKKYMQHRTGTDLHRCHWNRAFHYVIIGKMLELAEKTLGVII